MTPFDGKTSAFLSPLLVWDLGGIFELHEPLLYASVLLKAVVRVPDGFRTNFASVPQVLQSLISPIGTYDPATTLHDYLYQFDGWARGEADGALKEAMEVLGVGWWTRQTIYAGVRAGGWLPWKHYRDAEQVKAG